MKSMDPKEWEVDFVGEVVFLTTSTKLTPLLANDEAALRQSISAPEFSPAVASLLVFFFFPLAGEELPELPEIASFAPLSACSGC